MCVSTQTNTNERDEKMSDSGPLYRINSVQLKKIHFRTFLIYILYTDLYVYFRSSFLFCNIPLFAAFGVVEIFRFYENESHSSNFPTNKTREGTGM